MGNSSRASKGAARWLVLLIIVLAAVAAVFAFNLDELATYHYFRLLYTVSDNPSDYDFSAYYSRSRGKISVSMDVRAFALYAFMEGVAGYKDELGRTKSSERLQLESDLASRISSISPGRVQSWKKYYEDHPFGIYPYLHYVLALGAPPEFKYIVPKADIKDGDFFLLGGFREVLKDFFEAADIQGLYEWHRSAGIFKAADAYDLAKVAEQQAMANRYMKIDSTKTSEITLKIIPMPYESHYKGYSVTYGNTSYLVEGPGSGDGSLNWHEYLHIFVSQTVSNTIWAYQSKFKQVFEDNRTKPYIAGSYGKLDTYVAENIVRVMDHRIQAANAPTWAKDALARQIQQTEKDEITNGFALIPYFNEKVKEFEAEGTVDVTTFIKRALSSY